MLQRELTNLRFLRAVPVSSPYCTEPVMETHTGGHQICQILFIQSHAKIDGNIHLVD